jgi:hypothetical protein
MKKITIYLILMLALPVLLQAQYMGGNGRGDIKVSLANISIPVQEITVELPTKYDLAQNYPNPFNPTTNVQFSIIKVQYVTLKVFDILGHEVATLVNESLKPGTYEAAFDGASLTSGVYFYKLTTEGFSDTKRMLLVK